MLILFLFSFNFPFVLVLDFSQDAFRFSKIPVERKSKSKPRHHQREGVKERGVAVCVCVFSSFFPSFPLSLISLSFFFFLFPVLSSFCFSGFLFLPNMLTNLFFSYGFSHLDLSCHQPRCLTNGCTYYAPSLSRLLHDGDPRQDSQSQEREQRNLPFGPFIIQIMYLN